MTYLTQAKVKEYREANVPTCCPILGIRTDDWVLDHDHQTGMVRGVISRQANSLLGKVENFYLGMCKGDKERLPLTLEAMACYLEDYRTDVLHPVGLTQLTKKFAYSLTAEQQRSELEALGASEEMLATCKNQTNRSDLYRALIKEKYE
jgi:hypothetical protein|tara:strand:- start:62 stop:508 length:447 start_codon:yes stop_codon:yes gene_type:complete